MSNRSQTRNKTEIKCIIDPVSAITLFTEKEPFFVLELYNWTYRPILMQYDLWISINVGVLEF